MKKHPCIRTGLAALLTVALSAACIPGAVALAQDEAAGDSSSKTSAAPAQAQSGATYEKSEIVYAALAATGSPEAVYVVNRFDVTGPGAIVDHGDYTAVQNLTNETELARQGDATTFEAGEGTFFYQGDAAQATLPWKVALTYKLDGKAVSPDQLAGASGRLSVQVSTSRNEAVDTAFCESFMMQVTFTLPGGVATDVQAEGATVASSGQDTTVAFTALPGRDGNFELSAQVKDFHMAGVQIVALPYSSVVEVPEADGMVDGMESLSDAVSQLADGTASLASGVDQLTGGAQSLASGAAAFGQGLAQLDGSSGALVDASGSIKGALEGIVSALAGADLSQLEQLGQLPAVFNQLADGLDELGRGSGAAQQGYAQAMAALDAAMATIPPAGVTEADIQSLAALAHSSANPGDAATVDQLVKTYQAAQVAKGTYDAAKQAFDGADAVLASSAAALGQQAAALRSVAAQLDAAVGSGQLAQISQLVEGMSQLSSQYGQFHDGLAQYASGVSALTANYCELESGVASLASGTGQLASGAGTLSSGMGELNAATITLPETMRDQIAEMTAELDFPAFDPVSFVSPENKNVAAVQFVMATSAIEEPKVEEVEEEQPELTIWDRFVALFS